MVINAQEKSFTVRLTPKQLSGIIEDSVLSVFLSQSAFDQIHRLFTDRLPKDRSTRVDFDENFQNATLHVSGSSKNVFYREIIDVDLDEKDVNKIERKFAIISK